MRKLDKEEEKRLIEAILLGGHPAEKAIQKLYDQFRRGIWGFLRKKGAGREEAEDAFQEGLTAFWEAVMDQKFRGDGSIASFLFSTCRNVLLKRWASRKRMDEPNLRDALAENLATGKESNPEDLFIAGEEEEEEVVIGRILSMLGEKCRQVLERWMLSFRAKEIAEELGYKNENVVHKKKYDCTGKLKRMIAADPATRAFLRSKL